MIAAAFALVRQKGWAGLSTRSLADALEPLTNTTTGASGKIGGRLFR